METPTPVSALLHAGILNAGPFIAIRMAFVIDGANLATTLLIVVGGLTAVFASVVLLTQPSVKVALGYSSAAHMGFMLMVCGMGIYPAALLHLVAHSFYKAHAFLSSGSAIDEARAAKVALPPTTRQPRPHHRQRRAGARPVPAARTRLEHRPGRRPAAGRDRGDPRHRRHPAPRAGARLGRHGRRIAARRRPGTRRHRRVLRPRGRRPRAALLHRPGRRHPDRRPPGAHRAGARVLRRGRHVLQILEPTRPQTAFRRRLAIHFRNGLYANALFDRAVGGLRLAQRS